MEECKEYVGMWQGARRMLGHTSRGVRFLGRTNNHFKGLGISNPAIDKGIGMMEKYGLPTIVTK